MATSSVDDHSVAEEFALDIQSEMRKARLLQWAPVIILTALVLFFSLATGAFFTLSNLHSLLNQAAIPLVISLSITFIIVMGGINLSVEGLMAMAGSMFSVFVLNTRTANDLGFWAFPLVLGLGALAGLAMGLIHVKLKLPSFMVTYAASFVFAGLALMSYGGIPSSIRDDFFSQLHTKSVLHVPVITWIAFLVFAVAYALQKFTAFGQYVFAIGSNEKVLKPVGINIDRVKILAFVISGAGLALAGVVSALRLGRGDILLGKGMMFPAFTAIVLGGTPMSGGRGGVVNTLVGAITVTVLNNGLVMLGISTGMIQIVRGIVFLAIVFVASWSYRTKLLPR